jgi:hypothetical protein
MGWDRVLKDSMRGMHALVLGIGRPSIELCHKDVDAASYLYLYLHDIYIYIYISIFIYLIFSNPTSNLSCHATCLHQHPPEHPIQGWICTPG